MLVEATTSPTGPKKQSEKISSKFIVRLSFDEVASKTPKRGALPLLASMARRLGGDEINYALNFPKENTLATSNFP